MPGPAVLVVLLLLVRVDCHAAREHDLQGEWIIIWSRGDVVAGAGRGGAARGQMTRRDKRANTISDR